VPKRRYIILAEGAFADPHVAKTAHGVLRYSDDDVVAVVDSSLKGKLVTDILPDTDRTAPIVGHVADALMYGATSLLVGIAPLGGSLPATFRAEVLAAIDAGLEIVSGLHELLNGDEQFVRRAQASGSRLWDVRDYKEAVPLATGAAKNAPQVVVLAVGSDCAVGKMSVMLEIQKAASGDELQAAFAASGQTGIMISGDGIPVDRIISDFVTGAAEQLVLNAPASCDVLLIEGQGSILHPAYAPVTFGLLFGSAPDLLVLCHRVGQTAIYGFEDTLIPPLPELIRVHEAIVAYIKPAKTVAIALNTSGLSEVDARAALDRVCAETGLPADDVVRYGGEKLWRAISAAVPTTCKPQRAKSARA
jgi:uncharacterized NAD-dependent epimerase/dehydratase family protein